MKRFLGLAFFLLFMTNSFAYKLSDDAKITILTCSAGQELYTAFGHSAIWIHDPHSNINWIFHYGTFDFNQPNFYFNFVKGRLNYMLAVQTYKSFLKEYGGDLRSVHALELDLPQEKKQQIFDYLMWKRLPQNKFYLYDFFYDNCATRVRDVFTTYLGDSLILPHKSLGRTYRDEVSMRVKDRPWTGFGINLVLGLPADKELTYNSAMFLPDYVDTVFSQAKLAYGDSIVPLVKKSYWLLKYDSKTLRYPFYGPLYVFSALLLLIAWLTYRRKNLRWFDFVLFFTAGLAGFVILILWFFTDHSAAKDNLNLLWALPMHLVYSFGLLRRQKRAWVYHYSTVVLLYYAVFLLIGPFLPQKFDIALWPLILLMMVRLYNWSLYNKSK